MLYALIGDSALYLLSLLHAIRAAIVVVYKLRPPEPTPYIRKKQGPPFYLCAWIKAFSARAMQWLEAWTTGQIEKIQTKTRRRTSGFPTDYRRPQQLQWKKILLPVILTCMAAADPQDPNACRFDSDSKRLRIDNCLTASITNDKGDFVGKPIVVNVMVNGVGGLVRATHKGTVRWKIEDDKGLVHTILLPNSYLVPSMKCCL